MVDWIVNAISPGKTTISYSVTGSVVLSGLPTGSWTLTHMPGSVTTTGSTTSATISGLAPGNTFTFTVTNAAGNTSLPSENAVINQRALL